MVHRLLKEKSHAWIDQQSIPLAKLISPYDPALIEVFLKAGRLAQNPINWQTNNDLNLSEQEKYALQQEEITGWSTSSRRRRNNVVMLSLCGSTQGWIEYAVNTADPPHINRLNKSSSGSTTYLDGSSRLADMRIIPFVLAVTIALVSTPSATNYLGHRGTLFTAALLYCTASAAASMSDEWEHLFICRLIRTFALASSGFTAGAFVSEEIPRYMRYGQIACRKLLSLIVTDLLSSLVGGS